MEIKTIDKTSNKFLRYLAPAAAIGASSALLGILSILATCILPILGFLTAYDGLLRPFGS